MHAPGSSRTVLFDVGGVLVDSHPDPAVIARMFGDESRGLTTLVDQAMWTHRGDYDAGLSDRDFWDRIAGDCGQDEPPADLLKALVELDSSRMADANESTLSLVRLLRHQGVRVGILSNAPYPIAKAIRRSEWGASSILRLLLRLRHLQALPRHLPRRTPPPRNSRRRRRLHRRRRENVRAAELMGVKGILWTGPEQAEARLKELGFLF